MLFAAAAAHSASAKGAADFRFEVRADTCQGVCAGGAVMRRALGAAEAGRTDPDPHRAPSLDRSPAAAAARRIEASSRGLGHAVVVCAACPEQRALPNPFERNRVQAAGEHTWRPPIVIPAWAGIQ